MARPGLYEELRDLGLLEKGRAIALGEGSDADKVDPIERLIRKAGSQFDVTAKRVFGLRHRLITEPTERAEPKARDRQDPTSKNGGKSQKKEMHPHDGRRQNRGTPPPGPHSTGFEPGNDAATVTGEYRNPMLHGVSPERILLVKDAADLTPVEMLRRSIARYTLTIADMTEEIEAIKASDKQFWVIGTTFKRQEGDGELMGTGRIAQRQRMPRMEALRIMMDALTKVQARYDAAAAKLAAIEKGQNPNGGGGETPAALHFHFRLEGLSDAELEALVNDGA